MDYRRLIRDLEDRLRLKIVESATAMIKLLPYSVSSADGSGDKVQGYPTEGDEQPYDFEGRRVWPFGVRSRPPAGVYGVWLGPPGRSGSGVIVGAESSRFGPSDLADGEVAFYNKVSGLVVRLGADGKVTLTDGGGNTAQLDGSGSLRVDAPRLVSRQSLSQAAGSGALSAVQGAALGTNGSVLSVVGHDGAFVLTVRTDASTTPPGGGTVAIVTLESTWSNPVAVASGDGTAFDPTGGAGGSGFGATGAGSTLNVKVGSKLLPATVYAVGVHVRGY